MDIAGQKTMVADKLFGKENKDISLWNPNEDLNEWDEIYKKLSRVEIKILIDKLHTMWSEGNQTGQITISWDEFNRKASAKLLWEVLFSILK